MLSNTLDRISFWSLFVVIVLLPVFFLPFTKIPIEISKGVLLVIGLTVSIVFWAAARFSDGKIVLPRSWILLAGFGIVVASFISTLFSPSLNVSLFGTMLDQGTFFFIFLAFLLMLVSAIVLKDLKNAKTIFLGSIVSFVVVILFQIFHIFFPQTLSLGILSGKTDNILGSWNAFGIFAGFSTIVPLFFLEFFSVSRVSKWFLGVLMALSILLVIIVNFSVVWVILGIFALLIFVYKVSFYSTGDENNKRHFPAISFSVVMVALLFFVAGQFIGGFLPNKLGVASVEIRPSFSVTMSVAKQVLIKDPILGSGPNRFAEMWSMYKPKVINSTVFWDTSFNQGSGLLPTFAVTTGVVGILAWLIFLVLIVFTGIKSLFASRKKDELNIETTMFFIMSLYLFVASFFYTTGSVMILLAFAFLGAFIGISALNKERGEIVISFLNDSRKSFFSIIILILIMLFTASLGFKYMERFASVPFFQRTLSASSVSIAESDIAKAISLFSNDLYLRTYAQVYLIKINSLANKEATVSDSTKAEIQTAADQAVTGAQLAVSYNGTNYINYKMLGSVYETMSSYGAADAFEKSIEAYKKASELNPFNPGLKLDLARVSYTNGKTKEAKDYLKEALSLKPDYVDALITFSQILKSEGNSVDALAYAQQALSVSPTDKSLIQYVDSFKGAGSTETPPDTTSSSKTNPKTKN